MNSKAFAIFVGAIMVFSAFAGFVLMGSDQSDIPVESSDGDSVQTFGMQGNLVEWNFEGLQDVLEMAPEGTVMAYWLNMSASDNLTSAVAAALPDSLGLKYSSQLYSTKMERMANINFNGTWAEFHWIKPYAVGYNSLVIPYENYMMIPTGSDFVTVMGMPVLFGTQESVPQVIDVIAGGMPTMNFTLVGDDRSDLQVAALGSGGPSMPLSGAYQEFYLGVKATNNTEADGYSLNAKIAGPQSSTSQRIEDIASKNNLSVTDHDSEIEVSGAVASANLEGVLTAFLGP